MRRLYETTIYFQSGPKNGEFRSRAQTAPVNTLKRRDLRKDRERMLQHMLDNNNDGESFLILISDIMLSYLSL